MKAYQINEEILWDYADGFLSEAEAAAVAKSLSESKEWRTVFEKIKMEKAFLASVQSIQPSVDFSKNIMAAWQGEQAVVAALKVKKDNLVRNVFFLFGVIFMTSLGVFLYAAFQTTDLPIMSPGLDFHVPTSWAMHPIYLYVMLFASLGLGLLASEQPESAFALA